MIDALVIAALVATGIAAAFVLRQAWRHPSAARPVLILAGWAAVSALVVIAAIALGSARGPAFAMALIPAGALALVATGVKRREANGRVARSRALEPSLRGAKIWRGIMRTLVAAPLGCVVSLTLGIAWTVWFPSDPQTRIVLGGVLVPVLWAGAMAWALTDDRILRPALTMIALTLAGAALIAIEGF
ncbi:hypothetical protein [Maricaulis sp.]|uniref:hypothetical protein n=1 Tax=Maricaulis sp. TaxID=1486257 RepID=UPI001B19A22E|nr:hypothetical protein [Maricaulis sp.]MBO6764900.1 hypothetical protein [Maricaulis sp.]